MGKGVQSYRFSNLAAGTKYTFKVSAVDTSMNESAMGSGASVTATPLAKTDTTAPASVSSLAASCEDGVMTLSWTNPSDDDFWGAEITAEPSDGIFANAIYVKGAGTFSCSNLVSGTSYFFTVKALDTSMNESAAATTQAVTFTHSSGSLSDAQPLSISLSASVPQENGYTGSKSNTTVTATITTASTVKNVVYKKDGSEIAAKLLADDGATALTESESDNTKWTFTLTATDETSNGTYTVAAIDEAGREETKQIEIDSFDFTAPANVTNVSYKKDSDTAPKTITLTWTDPSDDDFDHVLISYITNDGTSDSEESEAASIGKGKQTYTFTNVDSTVQYYKFIIKSVDEIGNTSSGRVMRSTGNANLYEFHEKVTRAGTTTINSKEYKLVYFGDWPRTVKEDEIGVDESASLTMGGNTYYLGSDNNYYAKCTENAYSNSYTYSDGTTVAQSSKNSTKYFKVEPITWRVLTENYNSTKKALLLAEDILTANVQYCGTSSKRTLDSTTIYANNYKYSNIRAYLNGTKNLFVTDGGTATDYDIDWSGKGFLQSAFTTDAQSLIETTAVDNSEASTNPESNASAFNSGTNSYACGDTQDKIFLLSEKEVTTADYGFDSSYSSSGTGNARIRVTTDYAKANYAYQCTDAGSGGWWWLRSPYFASLNLARDVNSDGYANDYVYVNFRLGGIVPALSISLQ